MPRPLSRTVTEPSPFRVTSIRVAMAGERLVDGVVDDLVDHVVQAGPVIGVADVHARTLAHGLEAAQHLDRFGPVGLQRLLVGQLSFACWLLAHLGIVRNVISDGRVAGHARRGGEPSG